MTYAARVGDQHLCPAPGPGGPHKGGAILPAGTPTVLIGRDQRPAARVGDAALCEGAVDTLVYGEATVLIGTDKRAAARFGDPTAHGGMIAGGEPTVLIGRAHPAVECYLAASESGAAFVIQEGP